MRSTTRTLMLQATVGLLMMHLVSGCCVLVEPPPAGDAESLTPEQAKAMIDSDPNVVVLDVRYENEYAAGHIEDANNICYICSKVFSRDLAEFDKDAPTIVYSDAGDDRSGYASDEMVQLGFTRVYNMVGGLDAWIAAGYPVVP